MTKPILGSFDRPADRGEPSAAPQRSARRRPPGHSDLRARGKRNTHYGDGQERARPPTRVTTATTTRPKAKDARTVIRLAVELMVPSVELVGDPLNSGNDSALWTEPRAMSRPGDVARIDRRPAQRRVRSVLPALHFRIRDWPFRTCANPIVSAERYGLTALVSTVASERHIMCRRSRSDRTIVGCGWSRTHACQRQALVTAPRRPRRALPRSRR